MSLCDCKKNLGCVCNNTDVDTGLTAFIAGDYIFEISYNGQHYTKTVSFLIGDPIVLLNDFNENAVITFKVKLPDNPPNPYTPGEGINYLTSPDGGVIFEFTSELCQTL